MIFTLLGAVSAFISVGAGAFGAHALSSKLEPRLLAVWQTAAQYQMYHALALVALSAWLGSHPAAADQGMASVTGWAFFVGTILFSGSLYLLALTDIRSLGAITPLGGLAFLTGWASWILLALRTGRA